MLNLHCKFEIKIGIYMFEYCTFIQLGKFQQTFDSHTSMYIVLKVLGLSM